MKYRAFIGIDIEPSGKLLQVWNTLKNSGANLRMVGTDKLHITLKFLGDISTHTTERVLDILEEVSRTHDPFQLELRGLGAFPSSKHIKVIWVGVHSDGVLENISRELGGKLRKLNSPQDKHFRGHLTLARMTTGKEKQKIVDIMNYHREKEIMKCQINHIKLKKSILTPEGPIHETMGTVELGVKGR